LNAVDHRQKISKKREATESVWANNFWKKSTSHVKNWTPAFTFSNKNIGHLYKVIFFVQVYLGRSLPLFFISTHKQCILHKSMKHNRISLISLKTLYHGGVRTRVFCSQGGFDVRCPVQQVVLFCQIFCEIKFPKFRPIWSHCTESTRVSAVAD
jgi:hypothetical protein